MKSYKLILLTILFAVVCAFTYVSFMYVYTDHMFAPIVPLDRPHEITDMKPWPATITPFIHKINTPQRARQKDKKFNGFEVDVLPLEGKLLAAHDLQEAKRDIRLADIFAAVAHPQSKVWWIDIKGELSDDHLNEILLLATHYNIPKEHLFFEASPSPTAKRIQQKGLNLLLTLPDFFDQDLNKPAIRATLNAKVLALWKEYQPHALAASFGKYAYLQTYFPNMPKAIYYSATQRPSIKKPFMRQHMDKDSSVKIFMTDEYTWINL